MSNEPEKVDLETADIAASNRAALEGLFPGSVVDGVLDVGRLAELLGIEPAAGSDVRERYGLMWAGKMEAVRSLLSRAAGTLVPDIDSSLEFDSAQNVFIEGDNLEVLKLLQRAYNDRVKFIYIDPPYNTGSDFVYSDDFADGLGGYLRYSKQVDDAGNRLTATVDATGRRHSRWLSMIYPRLMLARNLLTPDGVIAVSIDDNEVANLRTLLDEIFGPENYLNTFVWVSNLKGRQIGGSGAVGTKEYILLYARNITEVGVFRASIAMLKKLMPSTYKGFDYEVKKDKHGPYVVKNELYNTNSAFNESTRENLVYDIYYDPKTGDVKTAELSDDHEHPGYEKILPKRNNNGVNKYHAYRWSRQKVAEETFNLEFVKAGNSYKIYTKVRDVDSTAVKDLITDISTSDGARDLTAVGIDPAWFDYPKPARLIQVLVACATGLDSLVMDFFSGSGTTAHAVALQNSVDGGRRRTISINLPEPTPVESEAYKAGLSRVSDITLSRLAAVARTIPSAEMQGLRVFRLAESNFARMVESDVLQLNDRTLINGLEDPPAVAAEVFVKEGIALDCPWEHHTAAGAEVITSDGVAVVLCNSVGDEVVSAVLKLKPRIVVFLEDGFANADAVKANAFTSAKNCGTIMKTI